MTYSRMSFRMIFSDLAKCSMTCSIARSFYNSWAFCSLLRFISELCVRFLQNLFIRVHHVIGQLLGSVVETNSAKILATVSSGRVVM